MLKQKGQSLIEVLIALAVTTIVIIALIIVVLAGLKNAQFAQNQSKATRYAEQAIDQIKTVRDWDQQVIVFQDNAAPLPCGSCGNNCKFSDLWNCHLTPGSGTSPCSTHTGVNITGCYFDLVSGPGLSEPALPSSISENLNDSGLTREVFISDDESTYQAEKNVIVRVSWTDSSGEHESNLQTKLTNH